MRTILYAALLAVLVAALAGLAIATARLPSVPPRPVRSGLILPLPQLSRALLARSTRHAWVA